MLSRTRIHTLPGLARNLEGPFQAVKTATRQLAAQLLQAQPVIYINSCSKAPPLPGSLLPTVTTGCFSSGSFSARENAATVLAVASAAGPFPFPEYDTDVPALSVNATLLVRLLELLGLLAA